MVTLCSQETGFCICFCWKHQTASALNRDNDATQIMNLQSKVDAMEKLSKSLKEQNNDLLKEQNYTVKVV